MFNNIDPGNREPYFSGLSFRNFWFVLAALCVIPSVCSALVPPRMMEVIQSGNAANPAPLPSTIPLTPTIEVNETTTIPVVTAAGETSIIETPTQSSTASLSSGETSQLTAVVPSIPVPSLSYVKAGLALMPTSYVRVSEKHPRESGFNSDFMFGCYIGELYDYIDKKHNFFERWYMFLFGIDNKFSFTPGQLFGYIGTLYGLEDQMKHISGLFDMVDPGSSKVEKNFFPTIGVGLRGWLFTSMGSSFELTEMFSNTQWIRDYYIVISKKVGDYGLYGGYLYGDFVSQLKSNMGILNRKLDWSGRGESHTYFAGLDIPSCFDSKKRMAFEFVYVNNESFLLNTTFPGIWGFDLALLKVPKGVAILAYWSFRSNLFTANSADDALKF